MTTERWIEEGNPNAPLWVVGEAPGADEVQSGRPFTGASGQLLDSCLREAGIRRDACYLTNVCHERPPSYTDRKGRIVVNDIDQFFVRPRGTDTRGAVQINGRYALLPVAEGHRRLASQVDVYRPRVVVCLGNTPLWGLAGETGITKWRGSAFELGPGIAAVAAFHPADCLPNRSPAHRPLLVHDLERAKRVLHDPSLARPPQWDFTIPTSLRDIEEWLQECPSEQAPLACDIETRASQIACVGLASSPLRAICIPFMKATAGENGYSYWSSTTELQVLASLRNELRTRPLTFHNGIYDCTYIAKQWGFMPRHADDTMVMQHTAFPGFLGGKIDPVTGRVNKRGSSLSLSFISSLYCRQYRYWKDDGRQWDPTIHDEIRYWNYNCEDVCRTWENRQVLHNILIQANLLEQYRLLMKTHRPAYQMMFRGFAVDRDRMQAMHDDCTAAMQEDAEWIATVTGAPLNPASPPHMVELFYRDLGQQKIYKGRGGDRTLTCDDDALRKIARRSPLLKPLCDRILHYRSMQAVRSDCDPAMLSSDGRLRTSLNPAFVETFRFSSNETPFAEGGNLQNLKRAE